MVWRIAISVLFLAVSPLAAHAQGEPTYSILVIDQERLFAETEFGRRISVGFEAASRRLASENREIEAVLIEEERALTDARATMSADAFRQAADAFDQRVTRVRTEQDTKSQALIQRRDQEQQRFLELVVPVLSDLMREYNASVMMDRREIFLSDERINVTDEAIERLDAALTALLQAAQQDGALFLGDDVQPLEPLPPRQGE